MNEIIKKAMINLEKASDVLMEGIRNADNLEKSQELLKAHIQVKNTISAIKDMIPETKSPLKIYTDGACSGNPGPGGFGVIMVEPNGVQTRLSNGYKVTTNNRMELMAVICALESDLVKELKKIEVILDSKYVTNPFNQKWIEDWKRKDFHKVANADLWRRLVALIEGKDVVFTWVKGHNGNPLNEECDRMAVQATKRFDLSIDSGYVI